MIFLEIFSFITTLSIFGYAKIAHNIPVAEPFIIWILCGLAVLICGRIFFSKQISHYIIISYLLLSILGLIQALSYYSSYQYFFAPFFDDSYYFFNVHKIYSGFTFSESTLYEKILVLPVFILDMLSMERESFLALLPANWMFGAFVVGLSLNLAKYLIPDKRFSVSLLAFLAVMGNSIFIDTSIHLYRDIFMLFFFLLSITFALKKRWVFSLLFCFLVSYVRSSNALLLLFFISLLFFVKNKIVVSKLKIVMICVLALIFGILLLKNVNLNLRSFSVAEQVDFNNSVNRLSERIANFSNNAQGSSSFLYRSGLVGRTVAVVTMAFTPLTVRMPYVTVRDAVLSSNGQYVSIPFDVEFLNIGFLFTILTVFLWIFIIPKIILFMYKSMSSSNISLFILTLFTIFCWLIINLISMQQRHRTFYVVLYPCLILCYDYFFAKANKSKEKLFSICLGVLLLFMNIFVVYQG